MKIENFSTKITRITIIYVSFKTLGVIFSLWKSEIAVVTKRKVLSEYYVYNLLSYCLRNVENCNLRIYLGLFSV